MDDRAVTLRELDEVLDVAAVLLAAALVVLGALYAALEALAWVQGI